jgi:predicted PurR-regulated permease PerM
MNAEVALPIRTGASGDSIAGEAPPAPPAALALSKTALAQMVLIVLGTGGFFYFARPVLLPIFLACVAAMTLKPLIRGSSYCHLPPPVSAAFVLAVLIAGAVGGFIQFGRPALAWVNDAPQQ